MNKDQLRGLIVDVLPMIDAYSDEAVDLLMGTAAVESNLGHYIKQLGGPARGIFQMEPDTEKDIWENYIKYQPKILDKLFEMHYLYPDPDALLYDLRYQIIMARLLYRRFPDAIPKILLGQAAYWKRRYNTVKGAGTIEKYLTAYDKYVVR